MIRVGFLTKLAGTAALCSVVAVGCGSPTMPDAGTPDSGRDVTNIDVPGDVARPDGGPDAMVPPDGGPGPDSGPMPDGGPLPDGSMRECTTSADCASSSGGAVCNTATGRCVQCTAAEDMCPAGNRCDASTNACVMGCRPGRADDCMAPSTCDATTMRCVGCTGDASCAPGTICTSGTCVPGCSATRPCGAGQTCCGSTCAATDTDTMNCGACGTACAAGQSCCGGACAGATDVNNCGRCGNRCGSDNGTPSCAAGTCSITCSTGFGNCDGNAANGCETSVNDDGSNCGMCGRTCPGGANATASCAAGSCTLACAAGFGNCDGNAANGCETNLNTSATNCLACGNACVSGPNSTASCAAAACSLACATNFANCDANPANGCEVNTTNSAANCGGCGRVCAFANATATCAASTCALGTCNAGFRNCDGMAANGCESNSMTDRNNCGGAACGVRCAMNQACVGGACVNACPAGQSLCGGSCVVTTTDANNCGACGNVCPTGPNGTAACGGGTCSFTCFRGFGNCSGGVADGCETNLETSATNCGACGTACVAANGTPACTGGVCGVGSCNAGFANCDATAINGCEVNTGTSGANCGACGRECNLPNASQTCAAGACTATTCTAGFANCNSAAADGCEINIRTSPLHCGACGRACAAGLACSNGACVTSCPGGTNFCAGACVNFASDIRNCGTCGNVCAAGQNCAAGACAFPVPANDTPPTATALPFATARRIDLTVRTNGANNSGTGSCGGSGRDVYYRFTLAQREIVWVDTLDADTTFDSVLYIASRTVLGGLGTERACNNDSTCATPMGRSSIVAILPAGDYLLGVDGFAAATGFARLHIEHLPLGNNGTATALAAGMTTVSGTTTGASSIATTCGNNGAGPEDAFYWSTCPGVGGGAFSATTCGSAAFDTVLQVSSGDAVGDACNDDNCGVQSRITASLSNAARLHVLYVDGYNAGAAGTYSIAVTRP